jgi:hypothetical protein
LAVANLTFLFYFYLYSGNFSWRGTGYRTGKSKANEKIWYKTNRLWGMLGVIASIIAFVWRYGAKLFLKSLSEDTSKTVTVIIFVSSVIIISIITIIFEQKLVNTQMKLLKILYIIKKINKKIIT